MGDFSYDLFDPSSDGKLLVEAMAELDFQVGRYEPTFFYNTVSSKLDFCAVTGLRVDPTSVRLGQFPLPGGHMWLFFYIVLSISGNVCESRTTVRRR